jgi:polysaccharide pyruvyl transferase CsaB
MVEPATSPPGSGGDDQMSVRGHSMAELTTRSTRQRFGHCDGGDELRIGVLGSYGGLNVGDEAILRCVLGCLRHVRPHAKVVVFSRNKEHTRQHHREVAEVVGWEGLSRWELSAAVSRLNLLILGGGGVLYDGEGHRYLALVQTAHKTGVPVFAYAVGAGPLNDPEERAVVRSVLAGVRDLTVRDHESKLVLEKAGLDREITVTADPALLLTPLDFTTDMLLLEGIPAGSRLVGMSVREPGRAAEHLDAHGYHELLAEVSDFLVRRLDAHVVFVPMERDDIRHSHAVLSHMTCPDRGRILHGLYRPEEILGLMQHLHLVVGMRLHFLIFAATAGVPFLPLPYAGKVFDFAQAAGAPGLRGVAREQVGPLLAEVDRVWDEHPRQAARVRERMQGLQNRARMTCRRLARVLDALSAAPAVSPPMNTSLNEELDAGSATA